MYFAMYGEFSNGDEKYVVNECNKASDGDEMCVCDLIDYATENNCELEYYTCLNSMPAELEEIYDKTGTHWFVDGVLMDTTNPTEYEYVNEL